MKHSPTQLLTTKEAAQRSGYSTDYLARLCKSGELLATRSGRSWLIDAAELDRFLRIQATKRAAFAEELAREREQEYREAKKQRNQAILLRRRTVTTTVHVSYAYSLAIAGLVLAGSAVVVGTGSTSHMGLSALHSALQARETLVAGVGNTYNNAYRATAKTQRIAKASVNIPYREYQALELPTVPSMESSLYAYTPPAYIARNTILGERVAHTKKYLPREHHTFSEVATYLSNPYAIGASVARAHKALGVAVLGEIEAVLTLHERMVYAVAGKVVDTSIVMRDAVHSAPDTIGMPFVRASNSIMEAYTAGVYAYVEHIERVPETIVGSLFALGDITGSTVAYGIQQAPYAVQRTAEVYVEQASVLANAISSTSYAMGAQSAATVAYVRTRFDAQVLAGAQVVGEGTNTLSTTLAQSLTTSGDTLSASVLNALWTVAGE